MRTVAWVIVCMIQLVIYAVIAIAWLLVELVELCVRAARR